MDSTTEIIRIHYRRPPDREDVFEQRLLERSPDCVVTFMERTPLSAPVLVEGRTILEDGSPVIWFTYPGRWHDVGLFHTADGRFTGTYANILTPVRFRDERSWETTDLFLDVWQDADGRASLLDEDEFVAAVRRGILGTELAASARDEARRILDAIARGEWPPAAVEDWSLERARGRLSGGA